MSVGTGLAGITGQPITRQNKPCFAERAASHVEKISRTNTDSVKKYDVRIVHVMWATVLRYLPTNKSSVDTFVLPRNWARYVTGFCVCYALFLVRTFRGIRISMIIKVYNLTSYHVILNHTCLEEKFSSEFQFSGRKVLNIIYTNIPMLEIRISNTHICRLVPKEA